MSTVATPNISYMGHFGNVTFDCSYSFLWQRSQLFGRNFRISSHLTFYPFIQVIYLSANLGATLNILNNVRFRIRMFLSPDLYDIRGRNGELGSVREKNDGSILSLKYGRALWLDWWSFPYLNLCAPYIPVGQIHPLLQDFVSRNGFPLYSFLNVASFRHRTRRIYHQTVIKHVHVYLTALNQVVTMSKMRSLPLPSRCVQHIPKFLCAA